MRRPEVDPSSPFYGRTTAEMDEKLRAAGWAAGTDVMEQVREAYINHVGGNADLAEAQLASLLDAVAAVPEGLRPVSDVVRCEAECVTHRAHLWDGTPVR